MCKCLFVATSLILAATFTTMFLEADEPIEERNFDESVLQLVKDFDVDLKWEALQANFAQVFPGADNWDDATYVTKLPPAIGPRRKAYDSMKYKQFDIGNRSMPTFVALKKGGIVDAIVFTNFPKEGLYLTVQRKRPA